MAPAIPAIIGLVGSVAGSLIQASSQRRAQRAAGQQAEDVNAARLAEQRRALELSTGRAAAERRQRQKVQSGSLAGSGTLDGGAGGSATLLGA